MVWRRQQKQPSHVVITGAASGIGAACARVFAEQGARLELVDIRDERLHRTVSELCRDWPALAVDAHVLDCTDSEEVARLATNVEATGGPDVVIHCVGRLVAAPFTALSLEAWQQAVDTNIWSTVHVLRAFGPPMVARGSGHLVTIASLAGLMGFPYVAPYSMTKFALVGLGEALGAEFEGTGVQVMTVCPGMVKSEILDHGQLQLPGRWAERFRWAFEAMAPDPRMVATAILSGLHTGQALVVPGLTTRALWALKRHGGARYERLARAALHFIARR